MLFKYTSEGELMKHKEVHKEINCKNCDYKCTSDVQLLKHKEVHMEIQCEQCDFKTTTRHELETHIKSHGTNMNQIPDVNLLTENVSLKRQVQSLTGNYDRLSTMYKSMKEETKTQVNDCKSELLEAQELLRVALAENEKLRETNDIQNNLWKMWLKQHKEDNEKNKTQNTGNPEPADANDDNDDEDSEDPLDPVEAFLANRRRGFARTNPAAPPQPKNKTKPNEPRAPPTVAPAPAQSPDPTPAPTDRETSRNSSKRYCHFWNNSGNCTFRNCIFLHEKAPFCNYDGQCNRNKCMFSHKKQNKSFLFNPTSNPRSRSAGQNAPPPPPPYWGAPPPWAQWGNPWMMAGPRGNQGQY